MKLAKMSTAEPGYNFACQVKANKSNVSVSIIDAVFSIAVFVAEAKMIECDEDDDIRQRPYRN